MATITVDRATRDLLHRETALEIDGAGPFGKVDTEEGVEGSIRERDRVVVSGPVLDALDWLAEAKR